ncbi:hypothetical protein [Nocardia otitidiscaviarum]|uniref:hypothetical protein n=1 Tax=Nocardia otitidiscaviarum TaxID=1823 RepID=UPI0004A6A95A|nr:hypothetical protein [Nocardia otitidiscaviarum]
MTAPASEQLTYTEALTLAAALYATAKAPKTPVPVETLAATARAAAAAMVRIETATVDAVLALWRRTNPYDDAAVTRFATEAGRVLIPAQRQVAQITAVVQTRTFAAAGTPIQVSPTIPDDVRGTLPMLAAPDAEIPDTPSREPEVPRRARVRIDYPDGERTVSSEESRTSRVLVRPAAQYRYVRSQGRSHVEASAAAESRARVIVDGNLQVARALIENRAMDQTVDLDREVIGYRRIIHPELSQGGVCGMCVVAADRIYRIGELKAIHGRCKCTVAPVFSDFDPGGQLNGQDLDELYKAAGGNTINKLSRVRYRVIQHSELGPMLRSEKGVHVPYLTAPPEFSRTPELASA